MATAAVDDGVAAVEDPEAAVSDGVDAPKSKRQRCGKLDGKRKNVEAKADQLSKASAMVLSLQGKPGVLSKGDATKLTKAKEKVAKFTTELGALRKDLQDAEVAADAKAAADEARAKVAAQKAEESKQLSDAGAIEMVTLRLKYQARFDNSVDGTEVEDMVTVHYRVTTSTFRRANYESRPMCTPDFTMDSESAEVGGMANVLGGAHMQSPGAQRAAPPPLPALPTLPALQPHVPQHVSQPHGPQPPSSGHAVCFRLRPCNQSSLTLALLVLGAL